MVNKTELEFYSIKNKISATVCIGSGETCTIKLITDIIKNIQNSNTNIKFDIQSGDGDDLLKKLDRSIIDFAVLIDDLYFKI